MPTPNSTGNDQQVLGVDVLRFIAALLVLAYHFGGLATGHVDPQLQGVVDRTRLPDLSWLTHYGWVGVEIFFVISGYVIAISARQLERFDFLRRRFLRLAPAAWICGTVTLALLLATSGTPAPQLLTEWLVTVTFWPAAEAIDPSYWTIGVEVCFYLIVATQLGQGDRTKRLGRLCAVIGIVSIIFALVVQAGVTPAQPGLWNLLLIQHGCFFALGMTMQNSRTLGWSPARLAFCLPLTIACVLEIHAHQSDLTIHLVSLYSPAILLFLAAILMIHLAPKMQERLSPSGRKHIIILLGKTTYPLYLIHQTAGSIVIGTLLTWGVNGTTALLLTTFIAIGVAMLIAAYAEPALRAYTARSFMNRAPRPDNRPIAFPSVG